MLHELESISPLIISAVISGVFSIAVTLITVKANQVKKQKKRNMIDPPLEEHSFFTRIEALKIEVQNSLVIDNKAKCEIFKDILINMMDIYKKNQKEFCKELNNITDEQNLYTREMEVLNKSCQEFSTYYKGNSHYNDLEQKALDIAINKFNNWSYQHVRSLQDTIQEQSYTKYCSSIYSRMVAILDKYTSTFNDILIDAEKTLNAMNGDLKGLEFRGMKL